MTKRTCIRRKELPPKYYEFIGEVIHRWAHFDAVMTDIIGVIMLLDNKERRVIVGRMDERAKIGLLRILGSKWIKNPSTRKILHATYKLASDIIERRHQMAHGVWCDMKDDSHIYLLHMGNAEQQFLPNAEAITEEKMTDTLEIFRTLTSMAEMVLHAVTQDAKSK